MTLVHQFEQLWNVTAAPPDVFSFLTQHNPANMDQWLAVLLVDQQRRWRTDEPLQAEDYLAGLPDLPGNVDWKLQLAIGEFEARRDTNRPLSAQEISSRFPDLSDTLRDRLQVGKRGLEPIAQRPEGGSAPLVPDAFFPEIQIEQSAVSTQTFLSPDLSSADQLPQFSGKDVPQPSFSGSAEVDHLCDAFETMWRDADETPRLEDFLEQAAPNVHKTLLPALMKLELWWRRERGESPTQVDYQGRFPEHATLIRELLSQPVVSSRRPSVDATYVPADRLKKTGINEQQAPSSTVTYISSTAIGVQQKGRYRLDRILGEGAFGRVYLGYDEELQRQVAIKVPTRARFRKPEDAEAYLAEARTVASLDHPSIVPVHDVGRTLDGSIYVVSKLIEGCTLDDRIKAGRPEERDSARLLAIVALALQHAHDRRLIHRDVKPANILLDEKSNVPYVADFGLAIREEDYLKQNAIAGTPAYMSPEQIRGEGHRLDGRSDIFSLGVILYELLTGRKPFRGSSTQETLHLVLSLEPRSPRELLDTIPAELERICLKALSKRTSDRYARAAEFADDLDQWLKPATAVTQVRAAAQVVPKGLRSFDAGDADFFLELLPGQRSRDGLPESIAFWKQRIEQTDPEQTFRVGLIYGPSGCGKSSLVKAGLLPHLSQDIVAVYVEATADDTETRILSGLRKRLAELSVDMGLADTLAALRRGHGPKVVIIIDQFEQWLHAHRADPDAELVRALRQCDAGRLQAIVMVRDDFWLAASRFMHSVEIDLVAGHNIALVDLFDLEHAAKVLTKFGQAFGKLPANAGSISEDEREFVSSVASGLAQDGSVVSVRLSLFSEMVKGKPWTGATLDQVGGTQGIGVNFLEETFVSRSANPKHRQQQEAARGVLRALLPELDTDIKGSMRSHAELLEASGYQDRPTDFNDLLRILDGELRLITPTDPEGDSVSGSSRDSSLATRFYQLTHDYLVPSLREWLTQKQRETRKGRAELLLNERAGLWTSLPQRRHLPSAVELIRICLLTKSSNRTADQQRMIREAAQVHGIRTLTWAAATIVLLVSGFAVRQVFLEERRQSQLLQIQNEKDAEAARIQVARAEQLAEAERRTATVEKYFSLVQAAYTRSIARRWGWTTQVFENLSQACNLDTQAFDPVQLRTLAVAAAGAFDLQPDQPVATDISAGAICFSRDGSYLAVGQLKHGLSPGVYVYAMPSRELAFTFRFSNLGMGIKKLFGQADDHYHDGIRSVAFSSDGRWIAAGTRFGRLVCWDMQATKPQPRICAAFAEDDAVMDVAFLQKDQVVVARSKSSVIRHWEFTAKDTPDDSGLSGDAIDVMADTDNMSIVHQGRLQVCHLRNGVIQDFAAEGLSAPIASTANGELIAAGSGSGISIVAARQGTELSFLETAARAARIFFTPESDVLVACEKGQLEFLSVHDGTSLGKLIVPGDDSTRLARISPDGRLLAIPRDKGIDTYKVCRTGTNLLHAVNGLALGDVQWCRDSKSYMCLSVGTFGNSANRHSSAQLLERYRAADGKLLSRQMMDGLARTPKLNGSLYSLQVTNTSENVVATIPGAGLVVISTEGVIQSLIGSVGQEASLANQRSGGGSQIVSLPALPQMSSVEFDESHLLVDAPKELVSRLKDSQAGDGEALRVSFGEKTDWRVRLPVDMEKLPHSVHGWNAFATVKIHSTNASRTTLNLGMQQADGNRWSHSRSFSQSDSNGYHLLTLGHLSQDEANHKFEWFIEPGVDAPNVGWLQIDRFFLVPGDTFESQPFPWSCVQLSPDSSRLGIANSRRELLQMQLPDMRIISRWDNFRAAVFSGIGEIQSLAIDREWAIAGCGDGKVRFVRDTECRYTVDGPGGGISALQLLPHEHQILVATEVGHLRLLSVPEGNVIADLPKHENRITSMSITSDGMQLATASTDGTARLWRHSSSGFRLSSEFPVSENHPTVSLSPDGRYLLTGEMEPGIRCWNLDTLFAFFDELGLHSEDQQD